MPSGSWSGDDVAGLGRDGGPDRAHPDLGRAAVLGRVTRHRAGEDLLRAVGRHVGRFEAKVPVPRERVLVARSQGRVVGQVGRLQRVGPDVPRGDRGIVRLVDQVGDPVLVHAERADSTRPVGIVGAPHCARSQRGVGLGVPREVPRRVLVGVRLPVRDPAVGAERRVVVGRHGHRVERTVPQQQPVRRWLPASVVLVAAHQDRAAGRLDLDVQVRRVDLGAVHVEHAVMPVGSDGRSAGREGVDPRAEVRGGRRGGLRLLDVRHRSRTRRCPGSRAPPTRSGAVPPAAAARCSRDRARSRSRPRRPPTTAPVATRATVRRWLARARRRTASRSTSGGVSRSARPWAALVSRSSKLMTSPPPRVSRPVRRVPSTARPADERPRARGSSPCRAPSTASGRSRPRSGPRSTSAPSPHAVAVAGVSTACHTRWCSATSSIRSPRAGSSRSTSGDSREERLRHHEPDLADQHLVRVAARVAPSRPPGASAGRGGPWSSAAGPRRAGSHRSSGRRCGTTTHCARARTRRTGPRRPASSRLLRGGNHEGRP